MHVTSSSSLLSLVFFLSHFFNGANADLVAAFGFPSEFPYDFDRFLLLLGSGPSMDSVAGSTAIESTNDVDEDFFVDLARLLSQSTLNEIPKLTVPTCCVRDKSEVALNCVEYVYNINDFSFSFFFFSEFDWFEMVLN
ncbi:uncharacterized protein G2W53_033090 [Senna tora]|uniref:Uncharacterized protein n=1 Tax=Senna tora TaxID=362788 RepID=A0A834T8X5_9FABA|nr:uncharacterized protein G2W53_033090 [Senna tora]